MDAVQGWIVVALTLVLAAATFHYARTVAAQRADALLPLLHWQEPHVSLSADWHRMIARLQVHIVLWNVGPGAARVRKRRAFSDDLSWRFSHFDEPSIIPSREQLIVQLYLDVDAALASDGLEVTAKPPSTVSICLQFEDVVERQNYTSEPRIDFVRPSALPLHIDIPDVPRPPVPRIPSEMPGTALTVREGGFDPDSRSPRQRRVPRDKEAC